MTMVAEAAGDDEMQAMAEAEVTLFSKTKFPAEKERLTAVVTAKRQR